MGCSTRISPWPTPIHILHKIPVKGFGKDSFYADDTLIYFTFDDTASAKSKLEEIFKEVKAWMHSKMLKLNVSKTSLLIISLKSLRESVLGDFGSFHYNSETLTPLNELKYLGVTFDSEMNFNTQISNVIKKANFALFTLKTLRRNIPRKQLISFVHAFVFANLDYCNIIYYMLRKYQIYRLQKIINRAARIIYNLKSSQPITRS